VRSEAVVSTWEAAGSWSGPVKPIEQPPVAPLPADITPSRINIADAIRAYLANRAGSGIVPATLRKRRTFAKQVGEFAAARGYVMLDQLRSIDVDVFYGNWQLGREDSSHERLEAPLGARRAANKVPFTDEELHCIIRACDQLQPIPWSNGKTGGVWTGDDVKDFIWVLVYTGLRISDVGLFNISRLRGNEPFLRAKKNGGDVFTWIPDWLRDRLHQRLRIDTRTSVPSVTRIRGPGICGKAPSSESACT
jgi:integrase